MRFSAAAVLAALTAPIAVSAKGRLGFAIGVRNEGEPYSLFWKRLLQC